MRQQDEARAMDGTKQQVPDGWDASTAPSVSKKHAQVHPWPPKLMWMWKQ